MRDPIVIEPAGFDVAAAWQECREYVEKCGGLTHEDGEPNWRAAFGADPGCCSCPSCRVHYWAWGRKQRCIDCGFEYPTDSWAQFSYGCQDANRISGKTVCPDPEVNRRLLDRIKRDLPEKLKHPYYRYGYENPADDPWKAYHEIKWREVLSNA